MEIDSNKNKLGQKQRICQHRRDLSEVILDENSLDRIRFLEQLDLLFGQIDALRLVVEAISKRLNSVEDEVSKKLN